MSVLSMEFNLPMDDLDLMGLEAFVEKLAGIGVPSETRVYVSTNNGNKSLTAYHAVNLAPGPQDTV